MSEIIESTTQLLNISADAYHADPCYVPSLSASIAKTIITRSAYHAWCEHPRLGGKARLASKAMDAGTLAHSLLLDGGTGLRVLDFDSWRTKASQEARDTARAEGLTPVLADDYNAVSLVAAAFARKLSDRGILLDGKSGAVLTWVEDSDYGPVQCRAMLDHFFEQRGSYLEFKTTGSADAESCMRVAWNMGYDIQLAAYTSAIEHVFPSLAGRGRSFLAFGELDEPHCLSVYEPDGPFRQIGAMRWQRAVNIWAKCTKDGVWPEYQPHDAIELISVPMWAHQRELGEL